FTTVMTPAEGRSQVFELQGYVDGKWESEDPSTFELDAAGESVVELEGPHLTGVRLRVRSGYEPDVSGDNFNATTRGPWKYFIFTR
ncbi:MAG TPA: hypothetical protein VFO77_06875, partial [Actinoplanes sp.]|nr:hypothetical protein [Actinoplanes sp.]